MYFFPPMPLTRFRSSALRNGRAAIMRAAITCPIPGTVVSSFSVAVLMSIFPSGIFSLACDPVVSTGRLCVIDAAGFATGEKTAGESAGVERERVFPSATKELKADGVCACTFNRPSLRPKLRFSLVSLRPRVAEVYRLRFANSVIRAARI